MKIRCKTCFKIVYHYLNTSLSIWQQLWHVLLFWLKAVKNEELAIRKLLLRKLIKLVWPSRLYVKKWEGIQSFRFHEWMGFLVLDLPSYYNIMYSLVYFLIILMVTVMAWKTSIMYMRKDILLKISFSFDFTFIMYDSIT